MAAVGGAAEQLGRAAAHGGDKFFRAGHAVRGSARAVADGEELPGAVVDIDVFVGAVRVDELAVAAAGLGEDRGLRTAAEVSGAGGGAPGRRAVEREGSRVGRRGTGGGDRLIAGDGSVDRLLGVARAVRQ